MVTTIVVSMNLRKAMYGFLSKYIYYFLKKQKLHTNQNLYFKDVNGSPGSPNKKIPSKLPMKEKSSNSLKTSLSRSSSKSATAKTPENPPPNEKKSKQLPFFIVSIFLPLTFALL